jgi:pimeloyl-ACP methyl ester carboxylesterase
MAVRPSQLRASSEETAFLIPAALEASRLYAGLQVPVAIVAGEGDRMVETSAQSARLHRELPRSTFDVLPGTGHMVHQTATGAVMAAVERAAAAIGGAAPAGRRP